MRHRKKQRRQELETPELDVTPFMNLMIVLVPVLLLSLVFTHTAVINLSFPSGEALADLDPDTVHLEVRVTTGALVIADRRSIIRKLPVLKNGQHDFANLSLVMQELKRRLPAKEDALILLEPGIPYQTLVFVMDRVRSVTQPTTGNELVQVALFPNLSLGDAP